MRYAIWSGRLINQHSFAACEFATDQGADDRQADDGGCQSDCPSTAIATRLSLSRSADDDCKSTKQTQASSDALIKSSLITIRTQLSPYLLYLIAFELRGLLVFD